MCKSSVQNTFLLNKISLGIIKFEKRKSVIAFNYRILGLLLCGVAVSSVISYIPTKYQCTLPYLLASFGLCMYSLYQIIERLMDCPVCPVCQRRLDRFALFTGRCASCGADHVCKVDRKAALKLSGCELYVSFRMVVIRSFFEIIFIMFLSHVLLILPLHIAISGVDNFWILSCYVIAFFLLIEFAIEKYIKLYSYRKILFKQRIVSFKRGIANSNLVGTWRDYATKYESVKSVMRYQWIFVLAITQFSLGGLVSQNGFSHYFLMLLAVAVCSWLIIKIVCCLYRHHAFAKYSTCPNCNSSIFREALYVKTTSCCPECGQKLLSFN